MKFKAIAFDDPNSQRVYNNYIQSIRNVLKPIADADKEDVLMEFNSHIYEKVQSNTTQPTIEVLLNAIEKLGAPEEVLKPLVADKLLEKATRTFNPLHVLSALLLNLTNSFAYIIFFFLYIFLGTFVFLIFSKIFNSDVGMYFKDGSFQALGLIYDNEGYQEVLGHWFIPVMILATIGLYLFLTLLLKLKRTINK